MRGMGRAAALVLGLAVPWCLAGAESGASEETDPMGANGACYVCHIPFVKESLSKTHLDAKVACTHCHGLSAAHANDEDIGATKPDKTYARGAINASCRECHKGHDAAPERVIARWEGRPRPEGAAVCTDCHGTHKVKQAAVGASALTVVLWAGGVAHDYDALTTVLAQELPALVPMELTIVNDGAFLDGLRPDVVVMNHCFEKAEGVLTSGQKEKLLAAVRAGMGVVALHASYYSFPEWDGVRELYGARFTRHASANARAVVTAVDKAHPVWRGVPETFESFTEVYESTPLAEDCHVVARARDPTTGGEHPSVWTRRMGEGRVVTILPGHWASGYRAESIRRLMAASLAWTARRD